ncbi:biotin-dependent carboxyltransferase family protein [Niallia sp. NCCP-28]|uniref:5-oxoprolinase subunit C family protein n=1 Tax=Niallia sp. NCCP-28 TaxID=2934712 RepID=UPI00208AC00B|nr:biotin-dependent carboxyltransferase family protein [Niallia sp. NCCP-28]GKU84751.1 KipI antagonist [Niallia sp. NCCP-28]
MSITILHPGLLTSIQDTGRYGFQKYGVIASGAMDVYSLRMANVLIGNKETEAALEITLMGPMISVDEDMLIAITGADLSPSVDGIPLPIWRPVWIKKGSVIKFGAPKSGCRSYFAVAGGFAVETIMDSKSTYLRGEIGGFKGRSLQKGDTIGRGKCSERSMMLVSKLKDATSTNHFSTTDWFVDSNPFFSGADEAFIRVLPGRQYDRLTKQGKHQLFAEFFRITPQSDRMGFRLSGPTMELQEKEDMLSEAVSFGTIQLPPNGNPIILLADRQTTGGYPKIAQVASVDLAYLAQRKPGEKVRFQLITLEEAQQMQLEKEKHWKQLKHAILMKQ